MDEKKLVITKTDAARRQLRTAIRLWFQEADPVSIHTLAYAAYEIVHFMSKQHDKHRPTLIFDADMIEDEYRRQWTDKLKKSANFFKHARDDPHGSLEFRPSLSLLYFMGAISGPRLMKEPTGVEETALFYWLCFHHPAWIKADYRQRLEQQLTAKTIGEIKTVSKLDFLEAFDVLRRAKPAQR